MTLRVANLASSAFPATVTDLTVTNNLTLSAGTANGVLYLDGSKVVTSGSNFSFNGTGTLTLGNDSVATIINAPGDTFRSVADSNGAGASASHQWFLGAGEAMRLNSTGLGIGTNNPQGKLQVNGTLLVGGQTAVRNTGVLGIGQQQIETISYSALQMFGNINSVDGSYIGLFKSRSGTVGGVTAVQQNDVLGGVFFGGADGTTMQSSSSIDVRVDGPVASGVIPGRFVFSSTNTSGVYGTRMTLDSSGNLGLGVTPSAWGGVVAPAFEMQRGVSFSSQNNASVGHLTANAFYNGANWIYKQNGGATLYTINNNAAAGVAWFTAPSGTAGNTISFTQAMTLDASGRLGIGTTNPQYALDVVGAIRLPNATAIYFNSSGGTPRTVLQYFSDNSTYLDASDGNIYFRCGTGTVQRLLIDTSGNVIVNTAAIATNATNGFLYVPTCAGTPTGTPTTYTGRSPIVVDSTNNKLYFYSGGAWRDAGP